MRARNKSAQQNFGPNGVWIVHQLISFACVCGALYGSWNSWLKYRSEPLSSVTTEVHTDTSTMPSLTICQYDYHTYLRNLRSAAKVDRTELAEEYGRMEMVAIFQG